MRKLLPYICAVVAFAACAESDIQDVVANVNEVVAHTVFMEFEGGDNTRIQLDEAKMHTVWTEGDEVSVFYKSDANQKYLYQGATGDRSGVLEMINHGVATKTMDRSVAVYPYNTDYVVDTQNYVVDAFIPDTQYYLSGSYGKGDNLMVAQSTGDSFSLKSVCGWLKLQLKGSNVSVDSISFRGNAGEAVAGSVRVNSGDATYSFAHSGTFDEILLKCGRGVELSGDATSFYIAIPPQTFANGFTIEVVATDGSKMTKSVNRAFTIKRNHIQPMAELTFSETINTSQQIYYTASEKVVPTRDDVFGATIKSNNFDAATGKGVITFNGNVTKIGDFAFYDCDSLLEITIPESVSSFGNYVFEDCDNLKKVTMLPIVAPTLGNGVFDYDANIAVNVYKECVEAYKAVWTDYASLIVGSGNVSGTTTIKYTTTDGQALSIVSLPIKSNTYKSGVGEMVVYGTLTRVNELLFDFNDQLKSITLPESITSIEYAAFAYSAALEEVTLGSGVTYIGNSAFESCESLVGLYCKATTPPALGNGVFTSTSDNLVVYVPTASVNSYKADADWQECEIVGYTF